MTRPSSSVATLLALFVGILSHAQSPLHLQIDPDQKTHDVSPTLYGLMTEEINYSYDGGLYAEMVRNRTFRTSWSGFDHWSLYAEGNGQAKLDAASDGPSPALPKSVRLNVSIASTGNEAGMANGGYWGLAVLPDTEYKGSFYAKVTGAQTLHVRLVSDRTGRTVGETRVEVGPGDWKSYSYTIHSMANITASEANHLLVTLDRPGSVLLQLVSLFPPTYHGSPNGNRIDLMEKLAAMHPKFLRLPGGNYLEGDTFAERYDWKQQVGPLVDRPTHRGPWNYLSSDGEGLLEMLRWCEDLHIEPVLAVFAGYSLKGEHVVGPALLPYVASALEEIEYVSGDSTTKWGAMRARDGHPAPFPLHYIEIGNEDEFDKSGSYSERFAAFAKAIRAKYPTLRLIATTPVSKGTPDLIDDHFYKSSEEFYDMVHHYDRQDRSGPKVFVGEWATRSGSPTPDMGGALGDAAWMTGMERNSDLIQMASYAPLFTNVNPGGLQWSTDLIGYDALRSYGSPSYWAQVLFATHLGDHVVASRTDHDERRFFWSSTVSSDNKTLYLKLVNASNQPQPLVVSIPHLKVQQADTYTLHAASEWATNSIANSDVIVPAAGRTQVSSAWQLILPPFTIQVVDIQLSR